MLIILNFLLFLLPCLKFCFPLFTLEKFYNGGIERFGEGFKLMLRDGSHFLGYWKHPAPEPLVIMALADDIAGFSIIIHKLDSFLVSQCCAPNLPHCFGFGAILDGGRSAIY